MTFGQQLLIQFGIEEADGTFIDVGAQIRPIDPGPDKPNRPWRNLVIPMDQVPAEATGMRIIAKDNNVNNKQWLAITPPRAPLLQTLQEVVGSQGPDADRLQCGEPVPVPAAVRHHRRGRRDPASGGSCRTAPPQPRSRRPGRRPRTAACSV